VISPSVPSSATARKAGYAVSDRTHGTELAFHSLGIIDYFATWRDELLIERLTNGSGCGATARLLLLDKTGAEFAALDLPQIPVPDAEWTRPGHVVTAGLAAADRCVDLAWADTMRAADGAGPDSSELWRQSFCCEP
jgi:hypothetical protein